MESYTVALFFLAISSIVYFLSKWYSKSKQLPPGPKPWPIIGSIHKLGDEPHRAVTDLSKTYGPIMSLKLGSKTIIVISSPEIAKEMFLKNDLALSYRAAPDATRALNHKNLSTVWLSVSPKWRQLRKIATLQLFTSQRLDASQAMRQKKVNELVDYVRQCGESGIPVDIGKAAFITSLNLLSNTFFSMDLASHVSTKSQEFKDLVWRLMQEHGRPNVSDFFPIVRKLDLQGVVKRTAETFNLMLQNFEKIIGGRLDFSMDDGSDDDVLSTLLKVVKDGQLTLDEVKHLLLDLFAAGTDTTSITLEWAMTELLRNPKKMEKAQTEMNQVLGNGEPITMQETDVQKLPYIHAIVKEALRLHPPGPLLLPHKADKDVTLHGYLVPQNSTIWVNVWCIGRDPSVWSTPEVFSPERFLESEIDVKGRDFELIPFGSGRRICPGIPLANRMVHLMLANLLRSFNWKSPKAIGVEERFGFTLQKAEPLQAIPLPR